MSLTPNAKSSSKLSMAQKLSPLSCSQPPLFSDTDRHRATGDAHLDDDSSCQWNHHHGSMNIIGSSRHHMEVECSMCGDVGFSTELFRCKKCLHRFQHTYCSRYYPSIPEKDVCDWCSLDANPSAGSSTATNSTSATGFKSRSATKLGNPGKRKAQDSSSLRKAGVMTSMNSGSRCKNLSSSSNCVLYEDQEDLNKDALELLLEVAQRVAEGQIVTTPKLPQQQRHQNLNGFNLNKRSRSNQQEAPKRQRSATHNDEHDEELMKSPGKAHQTAVESVTNSKLQLKTGKDQNHKLQLTSSRSIGRRYKLLSDVLCQKLAATNPTCG